MVFVGSSAGNIALTVSVYGDGGTEMMKSLQSISLSILVNQSAILVWWYRDEEKYSNLYSCSFRFL